MQTDQPSLRVRVFGAPVGAGLPVIMFEPLPGHGEANTRRMHRQGLVATAVNQEHLKATITSDDFWNSQTAALTSTALHLFERPAPSAAIKNLSTKTVSQPGQIRRHPPR